MSNATSGTLLGHLPALPSTDHHLPLNPHENKAGAFFGFTLTTVNNSPEHQKLLAAFQKAQEDHAENKQISISAVTENILKYERDAATHFATRARENATLAIPLANSLRFSTESASFKDHVTDLESHIKIAAQQAEKIAATASHSSSKKVAALCTKLVAFYLAQTKFGLVQLKEVKENDIPTISKKSESLEFQEAKREIEEAIQDLQSLGVKIVKKEIHTPKSDEEIKEEVFNTLDDVIGEMEIDATWRTVSDEEAQEQVKNL